MPKATQLRRAVAIVASLNLIYFSAEFSVAAWIQSVSLFAESIDFLECGFLNLLVFVALRWPANKRARLGMVLAAVVLIPGIATAWTAFEKLAHPAVPAAQIISWTGGVALAINGICAVLLARYRGEPQSLIKAVYLSARNDVFADAAVIAAGIVTGFYPTVWPDLLVGLCVAAINVQSAILVFETARREYNSSQLSQ